MPALSELGTELNSCVVTELNEVEQLRGVWEKLMQGEELPDINKDIDRYISFIKPQVECVKPYVVIIKQGQEVVSIVPGRLEKKVFRFKLGYKSIFAVPMSCLTVIHGGLVGRLDGKIASAIFKEILDVLRQKRVDVVQLSRLSDTSLIRRAAKRAVFFYRRNIFPIKESRWKMTLPDNMESFYKSHSSKHRKHLKRYVRKLEEKYPGRVQIKMYDRENDVNLVIALLSDVSAKTYQHALGVGFEDNAVKRNLLETAAKKGWMRAYFLFIDDKPHAFRLLLNYRGTCFCDGTGYAPAFAEYRLGTVLFLHVLNSLCEFRDSEILDLGFGEADYKRTYADKRSDELTMLIFANRFYPIFINIINFVTGVISLLALSIAQKLGVAGRARRIWRRYLAAKA